jgi:hypothetical protein
MDLASGIIDQRISAAAPQPTQEQQQPNTEQAPQTADQADISAQLPPQEVVDKAKQMLLAKIVQDTYARLMEELNAMPAGAE